MIMGLEFMYNSTRLVRGSSVPGWTTDSWLKSSPLKNVVHHRMSFRTNLSHTHTHTHAVQKRPHKCLSRVAFEKAPTSINVMRLRDKDLSKSPQTRLATERGTRQLWNWQVLYSSDKTLNPATDEFPILVMKFSSMYLKSTIQSISAVSHVWHRCPRLDKAHIYGVGTLTDTVAATGLAEKRLPS